MSQALSEWIDGRVFCPQEPGWYEVEHAPSSLWGDGAFYAHWDGERWARLHSFFNPDGNAFTFGESDGKLILPPMWVHETLVTIRCERWRGFLAVDAQMVTISNEDAEFLEQHGAVARVNDGAHSPEARVEDEDIDLSIETGSGLPLARVPVIGRDGVKDIADMTVADAQKMFGSKANE